jgi:hypothetical protein
MELRPGQAQRRLATQSADRHTDDNIDNARRGDLRASPATENALNYQATTASVELVLGGPPAQRESVLACRPKRAMRRAVGRRIGSAIPRAGNGNARSTARSSSAG